METCTIPSETNRRHHSNMQIKTTDITLTAMNAALYAAIGLAIYYIFPIVAPTVGGVRFWPVVIIPATFGHGYYLTSPSRIKIMKLTGICFWRL